MSAQRHTYYSLACIGLKKCILKYMVGRNNHKCCKIKVATIMEEFVWSMSLNDNQLIRMMYVSRLVFTNIRALEVLHYT